MCTRWACASLRLSGKVPFEMDSEEKVELKKKDDDNSSINRICDRACSTDVQRNLVLAMCHKDPRKRQQMTTVVDKLEQFAAVEAVNDTQHTCQPDTRSLVNFEHFDTLCGGNTSFSWSELQRLVVKSKNNFYRQMWHELVLTYDTLKAESHPLAILQRFDDLLNEFREVLDIMSQPNRVCRLSASQARDHSIQGLHRRISLLLHLVRPQDHETDTRESERKTLFRELVEIFVSEASKACVLLLNPINSEDDRLGLVAVLRAELRNSDGKYTESQVEILQMLYDDILSECLEDVHLATTPEWFIPWFELEMNEMVTLGEGGFGSVIKARWLNSEVVVKKLEISTKDATNADKMHDMRQMFGREVDIWFRLSHPHVVRLFGACHVGLPFFVCELAPNGTLVECLRHHPDEIWSKLREVALGVQYLHARGIVHGDLKGNTILVGSDGKAKVTDFGLSGVFGDDSIEGMISGAWHWVAPECLLGGKPTFASDVYSLGMCVVEALRVTNDDNCTLPWGALPNAAVKFHVTKRQLLPQRPTNCSDEARTLIERVCKSESADRMPIMTVVDELETLAGRHGDLSDEQQQIVSNSDKLRLISCSVSDVLTEMKNWIGKCDAKEDCEGDVIVKIYQLLWDRLEQVAIQLFPDGDDTVVAKASISDFGAVVECSRQRMRTVLDITGVIPLAKFTELALGGYALHRRLDKLIVTHGVPSDSSPLHDWTTA